MTRQADRTNGRTRTPRVEIFESLEEVTLRAEMPGVSKEDFDINIEGDGLSIRGRRRTVNSGLKLIRGGIDNADYYRAFTLGDALDADSVKARLESGILTLTLSKKPEILPRKVEVG
jgi:HSP20 family molecular chaperone IbpA